MATSGERIRLTGVGGQLGPVGVSTQWEYLESNAEIARRVLVDLEDRRVLFYSHGREDTEYCRRSAAEIRQLMTKELPKVDQGDDMDRALRAIRNSARTFVDAAGPACRNFEQNMGAFFMALEAMRNEMAPHIRSMAIAYGILIDHVLDENLPPVHFSKLN